MGKSPFSFLRRTVVIDPLLILGKYGVCFTCVGWLHSYSSFGQGGMKSFSSHQFLSSICLQPLSYRCNVASLAIFYRYFHANCSSDLANCMPPLLPRPRCTRLSSFSHPYSVHLSNARVNQYSQSFIPFSVWSLKVMCVMEGTVLLV